MYGIDSHDEDELSVATDEDEEDKEDDKIDFKRKMDSDDGAKEDGDKEDGDKEDGDKETKKDEAAEGPKKEEVEGGTKMSEKADDDGAYSDSFDDDTENEIEEDDEVGSGPLDTLNHKSIENQSTEALNQTAPATLDSARTVSSELTNDAPGGNDKDEPQDTKRRTSPIKTKTNQEFSGNPLQLATSNIAQQEGAAGISRGDGDGFGRDTPSSIGESVGEESADFGSTLSSTGDLGSTQASQPASTIEEWSVDTVCEWLEGLGAKLQATARLIGEEGAVQFDFASFIPAFRRLQVDGEMLLDVKDEDLDDLEVTDAAHREELLRQIAFLFDDCDSAGGES
jgi:hypothetical protein